MSTTPKRNLSDEDLTRAVLDSFEGAPDPRTKEILQSLVHHLHAFATDVQLTEEEWAAGIDFLTRTGHMTDDKRQEFILLSDVLGLSMLTIGINHRVPDGATESTVFGPFFVADSPRYSNGDDIANGQSGVPCYVSGQVRSVSGDPIAGANMEIWQADDEGFYDVQRPDLDQAQGRGHLVSADDGRYWFWSVFPEAYPIPADGPVGDLLTAGGRHPWRPAHIHFQVSAPGYETCTTHVFPDGGRYLDSDAVFGVKSSLIQTFERHDGGEAPDGTAPDGEWWSMHYDFVLAAQDASNGSAT
ncbi:MAG: hydroxyquinol 1,2-dioxygenase [Solirubrobacteraceae bacterium]|jgi:hydroxyquinol 1,2-dioxygenase|nr:hydroxyquinol 1,2-dioxygenase [Solirubrobacteraceae bacterium]